MFILVISQCSKTIDFIIKFLLNHNSYYKIGINNNLLNINYNKYDLIIIDDIFIEDDIEKILLTNKNVIYLTNSNFDNKYDNYHVIYKPIIPDQLINIINKIENKINSQEIIYNTDKYIIKKLQNIEKQILFKIYEKYIFIPQEIQNKYNIISNFLCCFAPNIIINHKISTWICNMNIQGMFSLSIIKNYNLTYLDIINNIKIDINFTPPLPHKIINDNIIRLFI